MTKIFISLKLINFPPAFKPQVTIPKIPTMQSYSTLKLLLTRCHILFGSLLELLNAAEFSSKQQVTLHRKIMGKKPSYFHMTFKTL